MRKINKFLSCILLYTLICIAISFSISINSYKSNASSYDYEIKKYDVDINVNEDNSLDIIETIDVYFNEERHGIKRTIPYQNIVKRADGSKSSNYATISNVYVNENYTTSNKDGNKVLQIGNAREFVKGDKTYVIKYKYDLGKDPLKNADELYFNIIGNGWDTLIHEVTFKITMPKSFDSSSLGFSSGRYGSTENSNVEFTVDGNTITGKTISSLDSYEGLTVRLTLPEGYFIYKPKIDVVSLLIIAFCIISVITSIVLWAKYGKDNPVIETVEFYPPEGLNSAELQFLYDGKAKNQGIISLLIYLANKGYLKIEETEPKKGSKSKGFKITKLKDYDGDNENEKRFMKGLFDGKTEENPSVTTSDLYNNFYQTLSIIESDMNSTKNKDKIFEKKASRLRFPLVIFAILIYLVITIRPFLQYGMTGDDQLAAALIFPAIGLVIGVGSVVGLIKMPKIVGIIMGILFGGSAWISLILPTLVTNGALFLTYVIGIISVILLIIFFSIMPKRTQYGNEMLGKIRGFKRFLEMAEKQQLENLVNENPQYFYNILPYTYALGVSDKWMKNFETIALMEPTWYQGTEPFNAASFNYSIGKAMNSFSSAMTSSPAPSSSGDGFSSSGGGFSGGGSGGGGGSSW